MVDFVKKIYSFFSERDKFFFLILFLLMVLTSVIELIGIGSLFPYIKILGDPKIIHQNHYIASLYNFFNFKSNNNFLILIGVGIFFMILLKGLMSCVNNYCQAKFTYNLNTRLSSFCLKSYMKMPYSEAIATNSAFLSKHLLVDVAGVASIVGSCLTLLTDAIIGVALISLMITVDPLLVASLAAILGALLWLSVRLTKNKTLQIATENEKCNRYAYRAAGEALLGLKDVKVYHVENYFMEKYLRWQRKLSTQQVIFNVISNVPALVMNTISFGLLLTVLLYLLITRDSLVAVLPLISLVAVCVQRLLPSANRISSSIGIIRRYKPLVYIVSEAVQSLSKVTAHLKTNKVEEKIKFDDFLEISNIYYKYPNTKKYALENVSILIKKNTTLGIIGESGAGKSTLVDVLLGLLPIESGKIICDNLDITQLEDLALAKLVGYVPQQTFLIDATLKENIAFGIPEKEIDFFALKKAIHIAQLDHFISELPRGWDTEIGENGVKLSGGQRQRLGIARALYRDPEILVMDEATNSLDSFTEKEFTESLKQLMKEKTIIIIAHRLSSVSLCNELIQIEKGKIVAQGTYENLMKNSEKFRRIYNITQEVW